MNRKRAFIKCMVCLCVAVMTLWTASHARGASEAYPGEFLPGSWLKLDDASVRARAAGEDFYCVPGSGAGIRGSDLLLPQGGAVEFFLEADRDGRYNLALESEIQGSAALKNTLTLKWDGQELLVGLPMLWKDVDKNYPRDRYGNEMVPAQETVAGMHPEYVKDYGARDKSPVSFELKKGKNRFTLKNNTQPLLLRAVYLVEEKPAVSYEAYRDGLAQKTPGSGCIVLEGEDYSLKSDSYLHAGNEQNPALYPYQTGTRLLNVVQGSSWKEPGQKILWTFEVEKAGVYQIGFRYAQNVRQGMSVYRNIEIDGRQPLAEMKAVPFRYTGLGYANLVLKSEKGEEVGIWLDRGRHTLAMEADAAPEAERIEALKKLMLEINDTGIDIKKLTGSGKDSNRTWDIAQYMPGIGDRLTGWADRLESIYRDTGEPGGKGPAYAVKLKMAAENLRELAKNLEKLPHSLDKLNEGSGSAAQLIADMMSELSEQPLSLDRIYVFSGESLPPARSNFFKEALEGIKSFIGSFFKKDGLENAPAGRGGEELTVWVSRPLQYVQMLQSLTDADFTARTGIKVRFSVMPNETKLILANSSGSNPDLAFGISSHIPYELAIRGATADLASFDDFFSYISREYNLETLVPYAVRDGIYAVTETQDFYVLMYRKDILDKLKLPVPDTWEDVKAIMPELQRHSMGFYLPMASWAGLKPFYTTTPFLYQCGGSIYSQDGFSTAINDEKSIEGFKLMTELFSIYNVDENAPNFFHSFRYGTLPIGVSNFSTYTRLMNAAPEIADLWEMAPSPGVKNAAGEVLRYQPVNDKADVLFANSDRKEDAWALLKWWLSREVQVRFANAMQTGYGPEYMWNTANLAAFREMNFPEEHKKVILEQWTYAKEVPRHPGGYMVEREISNAWTDVVMNGKGLRVSVDKAALLADREMRRKLEEFGYIENGKAVSAYPVATVEKIRERVKVGK